MLARTIVLSVCLYGCASAPPLAETTSPSLDTATIDLDTSAEGGDGIPFAAGRGPARVRLGSRTDRAAPALYVLLASTAITNTTGSAIGGNVGLSPAAASYITGFSLVAAPSNRFATSVAVPAPNKVFAANFAAPTPRNLTRAVRAAGTAFTDAAGRSNPDHLNLNGGDIGGLTLTPGLYTWGTSVSIPNDVTIEGGANDVWIFQISNDLNVSAAKRVILSGGARAGNIFWQISGQATIGENAHFEGIILSQTAVTLQTNASLHGRVYAQSQIALDDNAISRP
jgi:hypothetical protein